MQIIPIEKIRLPLKSRDELPPILAGKQATGRTGMDPRIADCKGGGDMKLYTFQIGCANAFDTVLRIIYTNGTTPR